jgi:hypothetical protein
MTAPSWSSGIARQAIVESRDEEPSKLSAEMRQGTWCTVLTTARRCRRGRRGDLAFPHSSWVCKWELPGNIRENEVSRQTAGGRFYRLGGGSFGRLETWKAGTYQVHEGPAAPSVMTDSGLLGRSKLFPPRTTLEVLRGATKGQPHLPQSEPREGCVACR